MEAAIDFAVKKAGAPLLRTSAAGLRSHARHRGKHSFSRIATDSADDGATGEVPSPSHCKAPSLSQHMCAHVSGGSRLVILA